MPNCILASGYLLSQCKENNIGGIDKVYLASWNKNDSFTVDVVNSGITSLTVLNAIYKFEQRNEIAEVLQDGEYSENGTYFINQSVSLGLHAVSASTRNLVTDLSNTDLLAIILDNNGIYWIMGRQGGCHVSASSIQIGKGFTDPNVVNITLSAKEQYPCDLLTTAAFQTLTISN